MTPSVLMRSTSHKRDFTQGNSGFFFFRVQEDFSVSAEARSPMPDATNDEVTRKNTLKTWPKPETGNRVIYMNSLWYPAKRDSSPTRVNTTLANPKIQSSSLNPH